MRISRGLVLALFALGGHAHAQVFTGFLGSLSCAKYVEAVDKEPNHPYFGFVSGFLTGTNYLRNRTTPGEFAGYRVWLQKYCTENPFDLFSTALIRLDLALGEGSARIGGTASKK
jgi:hypothetical protein